MRCPQCQSTRYLLGQPCPNCQFDHDVLTLEKLSNINYLLTEITHWTNIPRNLLNSLELRYSEKQHDVERELGLRPPRLTPAEATTLHNEQLALQALLTHLPHWVAQNWLTDTTAETLQTYSHARQQEITHLLSDTPPQRSYTPTQTTLIQHKQLRHMVKRLFDDGSLQELGYETITAELDAKIKQLEITLGLREPDPVPIHILEPAPAAPPIQPPQPPLPPPPTKPSRPPRQPFSWDKLWDTLLSEKTLKAVLFLAVSLLIGGAISIVVNEWDNFSRFAQALFLGGFTAVFYTLGWYVHHKMKLEGSGLALTAVASFLIPLDLYTYYISGGFPPGSWPTVWLAGSIFCLIIYTLTTYAMHSEILGYLIPLAAGSTALALSYWFNLPSHWWPLTFTAVPFLLALLASFIKKAPPFRLLKRPFQHMAYTLSVPVLIIQTAAFTLNPNTQLALALGLSWWLTTVILLLAIRPYPLQLTALATLLTVPIGLWLTQTWLISQYSGHWTWHAIGLATLTPLYIILGWLIKQKEQTDWHLELKSFGFIKNRFGQIEQLSEMILAVAWLLALIAGGLSFGRVGVMAISHTLLAVSFLLITILWQKPHVLWAMSLLLLTASGAWQGYRGVSPAQLALPWALLAILHVAAAVRLPEKYTPYRLILTQAAVCLAAFALIPPLILFDYTILTYALFNWITLTSWLAYLYHTNRWPAPAKFTANTPALLLQWLAAPAVLPWLLLLSRNWSVSSRALLLAGATWLLLMLGLHLQQTHWLYRRPWQTATHLTALATLAITHISDFAPLDLLALTAVALFYFTAAPLYKNRWWLFFAALLSPYIITLHFFTTSADPYNLLITISTLTLAYIAVGYYLQTNRSVPQKFLNPLYWATHLITALLLFITAIMALFFLTNLAEPQLPKAGLAIFITTAAYLTYAWLTNRQLWAYTTTWLFIFASALFVLAYSQGSGFSAVLIALLATLYITAERWLSGRARHKLHPTTNPYGVAFRQAWRLFRQPLHLAGWSLSAIAIFAAVVRNLLILEANNTHHLWSIITLLTITTLYATSAYWFKKSHFVYLTSLIWLAAWTVATNLSYLHLAPATTTRINWFAPSWALATFTLLAAGLAIAEQTPFFWRTFRQKVTPPKLDHFSWPPQSIAHAVVLILLMLTITSQAFGLATLTAAFLTLFYLATLLIDRRYRPVTGQWLGRFLYPAAPLLIFTTYLAVRHFINPTDIPLATSIILITYAFPLLWLGRHLAQNTPRSGPYALPLYLTSYAITILALTLATPHQQIFTLYLLLAATQTTLSTIWFKQPLWLYPTAAFLFAATLTGFDWLNFALHQIGWALALLGAGFFVVAAVLRRTNLHRYATPLLTAGFLTTAVSLSPAATDRLGTQVGFGLVSAIYIAVALWLQRPLLLHIALPLAAVPYAITTTNLGLAPADRALALWPGILLLLLIGRWLDDHWGWLNKERSPFPWHTPTQWFVALFDRIRFWWAFPFYYAALGATLLSPLLTLAWGDSGRLALVFALGTAVFIWAMYRFKLRPYLFFAAAWTQLALFSLIIWLDLGQSAEQLLNLFSPIIILTAALALLIEHTLNEASLVTHDKSSWHLNTAGWSRSLYLLLTINFALTTLTTLIFPTSGLLLLIQTILFALFATRWQFQPLAYLAELMVIFTVIEFGQYTSAPLQQLPITLATIPLIYGALSYAFALTHHKYLRWPDQIAFWIRPLKFGSWVVSSVALFLTFAIASAPRVDAPRLFIAVFAILGLLYLTISLAEQKPRVGYGALLLLLLSWSIWLFLIRQETEIQLYALPAATYLIGIGWLEWRLGNHLLAGWIDRAAFVLLIGSALWQSFGAWGGLYALLLIAEGLVLVWIGSTRRMRRHLYVGITAVLLAIVSQILEPLFNLNAFILLILGAALTLIGIGLERRLEAVRTLSKEFRTHLEHWD